MYAYLAEEFATELINVRSDTELDGALKQVSRRLGFDHFALSLEMRSTSCEAPGLLLHDYPDEWAKVYIAFDLAGQDPVRRACDKTIIGFAWDWIDELVPLTLDETPQSQPRQEPIRVPCCCERTSTARSPRSVLGLKDRFRADS